MTSSRSHSHWQGQDLNPNLNPRLKVFPLWVSKKSHDSFFFLMILKHYYQLVVASPSLKRKDSAPPDPLNRRY